MELETIANAAESQLAETRLALLHAELAFRRAEREATEEEVFGPKRRRHLDRQVAEEDTKFFTANNDRAGKTPCTDGSAESANDEPSRKAAKTEASAESAD